MKLSHGPCYFCPLWLWWCILRYVSRFHLAFVVCLCSMVTHPTWAELINSADPSAKGESHAAIWEPGRCRAGKMKEEWAFDFTKESWHVCADFFPRDDITWFPVATCNLATVLLLSLSSPRGEAAGSPGSAKCLQTSQPQLQPVCLCRLFAPISEIHLRVEGNVLSLLLNDPSAKPINILLHENHLIFQKPNESLKKKERKKTSCFISNEKVSTCQEIFSNLKLKNHKQSKSCSKLKPNHLPHLPEKPPTT